MDLAWLEPEGATLRYRRNPLPGAVEITWSLEDLRARERPGDDGAPIVPLPYCSKVRGVVTDGASGSPVPGVRVESFLLDPSTWQRTLDQVPPRGMEFVAPYPAIPVRLAHYDLLRLQSVPSDTSFDEKELIHWVMGGGAPRGRESEFERFLQAADVLMPVPRGATSTDANGRFELLLDGSGFVLLRLSGQGRVAQSSEFSVEPGVTLDLAFALATRPVVRVTLTDDQGNPLSGVQVRVFVRMAPQDFDSSERAEDMAMPQMAVGLPGAMRTIRYMSAVTDDGGIIELTMPYGLGYAALAEVEGKVAFDSILFDPPPLPQDLHSVELHLVPGEAGGVPGRVVVLDGEGRPLAGAKVQFGIASDPWQRQFPEVTLDAEGAIELDWFPEGAHIGGAVQHPSLGAPIMTLRYFDWSRGLNVARLFVKD